MKIRDLLKQKRVTISMEVFPPKTDTAFQSVSESVRAISRLHPSFVSCTYGAGGGTSRYTVEISRMIKEEGVTSMAHLTCISSTRDTVRSQIGRIRDAGIENILALRGDIPEGMDFPSPRYFEHADQLIREIRDVYPDVCIGGACYPEKHPEAVSKNEDIRNIKRKVDAGCDFLTTQMFFDNSIFYNYLYRLREAGIFVPVLAGIMPVTNKKQIQRMVAITNAKLPKKFVRIMDKYENDPVALRDAGIAYAVSQIVDLIANDVDGIHLYTMNNPFIASRICEAVQTLFK